MTTEELYDHCVTANKELEQVATGLASIDENAAQGVSQMADVVHKICVGLAKSLKDEPPPAPEDQAAEHERPTMDSAVRGMVAKHRAAREQAQQ